MSGTPSPEIAGDGLGASVPDRALAVPVEPASGLAPSGFDPSRDGFRGDMDRAFEIAVATLHLSDHHEAGARLFYADGLNNRAGHLTPYMASRVIAAVFAALAAFKFERNAVEAFINRAADAFSEVPMMFAEGQSRRDAYAYSLDAVVRYHALADHIHERAHLASAIEAGTGETGAGSTAEGGESAVPQADAKNGGVS